MTPDSTFSTTMKLKTSSRTKSKKIKNDDVKINKNKAKK